MLTEWSIHPLSPCFWNTVLRGSSLLFGKMFNLGSPFKGHISLDTCGSTFTAYKPSLQNIWRGSHAHLLVVMGVNRNREQQRVQCTHFFVPSLRTNASLPRVYTSVIFERRLMTWIFAKKMSLWPTLVLLLNISVMVLCKGCLLLHNRIPRRWQAVTCKVDFYYFFCGFNSQSLFSVFPFPFHMLIVIWTN